MEIIKYFKWSDKQYIHLEPEEGKAWFALEEIWKYRCLLSKESQDLVQEFRTREEIPFMSLFKLLDIQREMFKNLGYGKIYGEPDEEAAMELSANSSKVEALLRKDWQAVNSFLQFVIHLSEI